MEEVLKMRIVTLPAGVLLLALTSLALAHGPVPRVADQKPVEARLFIADSATSEVVVVDLPGGEVVTRLSTPPFTLSFGLAGDERHVFALRGRDTDLDTVTVIATGLDRATGMARFPYVVRTFIGHAPGGIRDDYLAQVGGQDAILNEETAEMLIFGSNEFGGLAEVPARRIPLLVPDHYHYLEAGEKLYVGHLARGLVQIIDRASAEEVGRIERCPVLHGMAKDQRSGRLFFACRRDVMVVGTRGAEADQEVARIPYPDEQRIGVFQQGQGRVVFGSTEGANPAILRLNMAREPYRFQSIPVDAAIQRGGTRDGRFVLLYTRAGQLEVRNGRSGRLLRTVTISAPFDSEYHEHVDKALLPAIATIGHTAWVTIPPEGVLVEVDIRRGTILRRIELGGEPTRLLIVQAD